LTDNYSCYHISHQSSF